MTLTQLLADFYRRTGFGTTVDSATSTRATAYINEVQQEILSEPGMETLLYDTLTFASVASQPAYGLPPPVGRVRAVYESTNILALDPMSADAYRHAYPSPTAVTGIPSAWVDLGYTAVAAQPANDSVIYVKSTSAGDTTQTVYLEGVRSGGFPKTDTATLNGTTAAAFGGGQTYSTITNLYLDAVTAGSLTITEDSGAGATLAIIASTSLRSRYRTIALAICPASAITYTVDYERDVSNLVNGTDEPVLPPRFHRLLAIGARMKEYEKLADGRHAAAKAEYLNGLNKLKYFIYSQAVGTPNATGRYQASRSSTLGAQYPSGT